MLVAVRISQSDISDAVLNCPKNLTELLTISNVFTAAHPPFDVTKK